MSDGGTNESNERGDEEGGGGTVSEPGGGPRRVVSETSVDDILESLGDTPANEPSDGSTDETAGGPTDESADRTGDVGKSSRAAAARTANRSSDTTEPVVAGDHGSATGTTAPTSEPNEPDEPGDGTELTYEDGDALAGRVAANDVTGADVRAAETDPGRESTPEIDDVELSLDDIENGQIGGAASTADSDASPNDDGAHDGDSDEADARADDGDTGGVAGLFRRLFPW